MLIGFLSIFSNECPNTFVLCELTRFSFLSQHARVLLISTHVPVAVVFLSPGLVTWMMIVAIAQMNHHLVVSKFEPLFLLSSCRAVNPFLYLLLSLVSLSLQHIPPVSHSLSSLVPMDAV